MIWFLLILLWIAPAHAQVTHPSFLMTVQLSVASQQPTGITLTAGSIADNAASGATVGTLSSSNVTMSHGGFFHGTCSLSDINTTGPGPGGTFVAMSGCTIQTAGTYTSSYDGVHTGITLQACQNGGCVSQPFTLTILAGGLTAPPQAVAAGFTTLVFNLDFTGATQSQVNGADFDQSIMSGSGSWWDCLGASSPKFYNVPGGSWDNLSCSGRSSIIADTDNGPLGTGRSVNVLYNHVAQGTNGIIWMSLTDGGNPPIGTLIPFDYYIEFRVRTDAASDTASAGAPTWYAITDIWEYGAAALNGSTPSEWDFVELGAGNSAIGVGDTSAIRENGSWVDGYSGYSTLSGYNHEQYNTWGFRVTSDTSGDIGWCEWVNNVNVACHGLTWSASYITNPTQWYMTTGNDDVNGQQANSYLEYVRVWSCSNWNNVNTGPAYNGNVCAGTVLTTP